jgi:putative exosortase-associated protein (TIGR04073 family)
MDNLIRNILLTVLALTLVLPAASDVYAQMEMMGMPMDNFAELNKPKPSPTFLETLNLSSKEQDELFPSKLGSGVTNMSTCWTDVPRQIDKVSQEKDLVQGYTIGFGEGIFLGVARGISGAYDTATCLLPTDSEPFMKPEYTIDNPSKEGLKINLFTW